jgi:glycosyltransferase involved in cell wall biosynthesis
MSTEEVAVPEPLVTVVIPTRDRPGLLASAVDSALAQTCRAVEVVVVDDASRTPPRLPRDDGRLRLLRVASPGGVCAARNRGLAAARGRWVTFLDDDDRLEPAMLETALAAADASPLPAPVAAVSGVREVDDRDLPVRELLPVSLPLGRHYTLEDHLPGDPSVHNSLVVPTAVARAIGGWDESLPAWEHLDLFLRLNAVCSIQAVERLTYRRRAHRGGRLSEDVAARAEGILRTLAKHEPVFAAHPRRHAHYLGAVGIAWLRLGRWGPAVAATSRSLRLAPGRPKGVGQWAASLAGPRVWALVDPRRDRLRRPLPAEGVRVG